ncbi:MAG: ferrochelatase [Planctomycetes bacterium]|nr:ferrochelatase [Planctomycetota bacterium]NUQ33896.1 ferrochelatase [Planctomycetaceae bacterium]
MAPKEKINILLVSFGGPTPGCCKRVDPCPGEAYCFVSGIFGHNPARKERIDEVVEHYTTVGGFSRFNEITEAQGEAVRKELSKRGVDATIYSGYHHWKPYVSDVIAGMANEGVGEFLVLVMSPHQSSVSWDGYVRLVAESINKLGSRAPQVLGVVEPFWNATGFIDAIADNVRAAAKKAGWSLSSKDTAVLFSAHSVPESVSKTSPYCSQIVETSRLVLQKLGSPNAMGAYQSQPEDSRIPWTGPFLKDGIKQLASDGIKNIIGIPVGFLGDNVEVLYDLGIEGEYAAKEHGARFVRAEAVNTHPAFITMLADRVQEKLAQVAKV